MSRRASRRNEFFQEPTGSLGERSDADRYQAPSANISEPAAMADQTGGFFSSHGKHLIPVDDRTVNLASAGDDREIQPGLVPDAVHRSPALACIDCFGFNVLPHLTEGALSGLANSAYISAIPDVRRNRTIGEYFKGCCGSLAWYQEHVQEDA